MGGGRRPRRQGARGRGSRGSRWEGRSRQRGRSGGRRGRGARAAVGRRSRQGSRKHRAGLVEEAERGSARGMKRGRGGENAGERTCKHGPKSRREERDRGRGERRRRAEVGAEDGREDALGRSYAEGRRGGAARGGEGRRSTGDRAATCPRTRTPKEVGLCWSSLWTPAVPPRSRLNRCCERWAPRHYRRRHPTPLRPSRRWNRHARRSGSRVLELWRLRACPQR